MIQIFVAKRRRRNYIPTVCAIHVLQMDAHYWTILCTNKLATWQLLKFITLSCIKRNHPDCLGKWLHMAHIEQAVIEHNWTIFMWAHLINVLNYSRLCSHPKKVNRWKEDDGEGAEFTKTSSFLQSTTTVSDSSSSLPVWEPLLWARQYPVTSYKLDPWTPS